LADRQIESNGKSKGENRLLGKITAGLEERKVNSKLKALAAKQAEMNAAMNSENKLFGRVAGNLVDRRADRKADRRADRRADGKAENELLGRFAAKLEERKAVNAKLNFTYLAGEQAKRNPENKLFGRLKAGLAAGLAERDADRNTDSDIDEVPKESIRDQFYALRDDSYTLEDAIRNRENEINRLREELYAYRPGVEEKKYTLSEFEKETEYIQATEAHLTSQLTKITAATDEEVNAMEDLKTKITIIEDEVKDFDEQVKNYHQHISQIKEDIWNQRKAITELDEQYYSTHELSEIERRLYYANDKKRGFESELDRNNRKVSSLREIFDRLNRQRIDREQEHNIDDDENRVIALENIIESLETKIRGDLSEIDTLVEQRNDLHRHADGADVKLRETKSILESLRNNSQILEADNKCLRNDLTKMAQRDEGKYLKV
jgi:chromosome segregation ATPase